MMLKMPLYANIKIAQTYKNYWSFFGSIYPAVLLFTGLHDVFRRWKQIMSWDLYTLAAGLDIWQAIQHII